MELRAAIEALNALPQDAYGIIPCNSEYALKGVTEWRRGWEARRWRNSKGQPVANAGLWQILFKLSDERPDVHFQWLRGQEAVLIDGHHRLAAYTLAERTSDIPVRYFEGTLDETVLRHSVAKTTSHALESAISIILKDI
jgi:ribonuclease HI